ncbi:MAG: hypothetical protein K5917_04560 [Clostridiales bacterium]|nr:hypothetical protein [Clostridiales bacterium]
MFSISELVEKANLKVLVEGDTLEKEITGCYCGDLLSWVMSRAKSGDAWITVMGNINCVAVALLADVACIILSEDAVLDDDAKLKAEAQGITILSTDKTTYDTACIINTFGV